MTYTNTYNNTNANTSSTSTPFDLSQFDDPYEIQETPSYASVPDGKYLVRVERCALEQSKSSGNLLLKWQFEILSPTSIGAKLFKNHNFNPDGLKWMKKDLITIGFEGKPSQLPNALESFLDMTLEVQVKNKEVNGTNNSNVYINKKVEGYTPDPSTSTYPSLPGTNENISTNTEKFNPSSIVPF